MAVRQEQIELMKLRKSLNKALRDNEMLRIDYEYDLGAKDARKDSERLVGHLMEVKASLESIRELMR